MKKERKKLSELIKIIKKEYDSISKETIEKLIESFPSRLHQWIKKEIKYFINDSDFLL